jgi:hypothetical protein
VHDVARTCGSGNFSGTRRERERMLHSSKG